MSHHHANGDHANSGSTDYDYASICRRLARDVLADYPHQVLDPARHADFGAVIFPGYGFGVADHISGGLAVARACLALLLPGSALRGDARLFRRVEAGIAFLRRAQRKTGLIDLPRVDFDSPPDTAFLVQLLCPILSFARATLAGHDGHDGHDAHASAIDAGLTPLIASAAAGMVDRGFRTPNHRWVVCSALAQASSLVPELDARPYVERILAETVDVNADGEYSERSTGVYSAVCNRAFRFIADHFGRPDLLDAVRANLDFTASLLDPRDGTVITSVSTRQDKGKAVVPITMADSFFDMGHRDGNARWLAIADLLVRHGLSGDDGAFAAPWLVEPFLQYPERRRRRATRSASATSEDAAAATRDAHGTSNGTANGEASHGEASLDAAPPAVKFYPSSKLWRLWRDDLSAFAAAGTPNAFSMTFGDIAIAALRCRTTYFHVGQFNADAIEPLDGPDGAGVRLTHLGARRSSPGWDLPLNRPVRFDNPHHGYYKLADEGTRDRWLLPTLDMQLDVREVPGGFDLDLTLTGGYDRMPVAIELFIRAGGLLECDDLAFAPAPDQTIRLRRAGPIVYHTRHHAIAIEGGADEHRLSDDILTGGMPGCFRAVASMLTPVKRRRIRIRCGQWSESERALLSEHGRLLASPAKAMIAPAKPTQPSPSKPAPTKPIVIATTTTTATAAAVGSTASAEPVRT